MDTGDTSSPRPNHTGRASGDAATGGVAGLVSPTPVSDSGSVSPVLASTTATTSGATSVTTSSAKPVIKPSVLDKITPLNDPHLQTGNTLTVHSPVASKS